MGDFKVLVYCNCCWSSHASSWLHKIMQ
jgi:hypothetical protein